MGLGGVDGSHDRGGSVPDQAIQQSTVNLTQGAARAALALTGAPA